MAGRFDHIVEVGPGRYDCLVEIGKFNPYHDERGRFASAPGGASIAMGVNGASPAGKRLAVAGTLQQVEKANLNLDHEVATIVNPDNGKVIFSKEGGRDGMSFNKSELWELKGQVLTHNHPDGVIFSPSDVAMAYSVKTIRATAPDGGVYELSWMNRRDAVTAYNDHYMKVRAESLKQLGVAENTLDRNLTPEQRKASFDYISQSCHQWLSDNASKYHYQYRKGRIDDGPEAEK